MLVPCAIDAHRADHVVLAEHHAIDLTSPTDPRPRSVAPATLSALLRRPPPLLGSRSTWTRRRSTPSPAAPRRTAASKSRASAHPAPARLAHFPAWPRRPGSPLRHRPSPVAVAWSRPACALADTPDPLAGRATGVAGVAAPASAALPTARPITATPSRSWPARLRRSVHRPPAAIVRSDRPWAASLARCG